MKRVVVIMFTLLLWIPQVTFASSTRRTVIELIAPGMDLLAVPYIPGLP